MNSLLKGACFASALAIAFSASASAFAHELRPDGHAPAGVMAEHVHGSGDWMAGLRLSRDRYSGGNRRGMKKISDLAIANAGYSAAVHGMTMDMVMLDIMYAPSDRVTLMLMPHYMRMKMVMRGLPATAANGGSGHGHSGHSLEVGERASHSHEGWGDTKATALLSLVKSAPFKLHAMLGVSIPTGSVSAKDEEGRFLHYGMQTGSGTWDLMPGITAHGEAGNLGWGAQASYTFRAEEENDSGFRFGDRLAASGWLSYRFLPPVSVSARLAYSKEGKVEGHYNGPHNHSAPSDRQANYGGQVLEAGLGLNAVAMGGPLKGFRLGAELLLPVHQDLNGIQIEKTSSFQLSLSKAF